MLEGCDHTCRSILSSLDFLLIVINLKEFLFNPLIPAMERNFLILASHEQFGGWHLLKAHIISQVEQNSYRKVEFRVFLDANYFEGKAAEAEVLLFWLLTSILHPEDIHIIVYLVFVVVFQSSNQVNSLGSASIQFIKLLISIKCSTYHYDDCFLYHRGQESRQSFLPECFPH